MTESNEDDDMFALEDDDAGTDPSRPHRTWTVVIVDDDKSVHQATEFALEGTPIMDRQLQFLHAYSSQEATELLRTATDVAVILLDVVMESEDSGLRMVKVIREDLGITEARIILRTGQPGYAPEMDAIRDYDINDYKTKSELSRNRLYTTLTSAIRSYQQIHTINASRRGLDMIIRASGQLMARHGFGDFAAGVITQIAGLLSLPPEGVVCAHDNRKDGVHNQETIVVAAAGRFSDCIDLPLSALKRPEVATALTDALAARCSLYEQDSTTLFFSSESGHDMVAYLETGNPLEETDRHLLEVFCANIAISLDNVVLFSQLHDYAFKDQLLGIPNRLSYIHAVNSALKEARRATDVIALVDIDHFFELNDSLGHRYGDALLVAVNKRLAESLPAGSFIARVATDTFGILGTDTAVTPAMLKSIFKRPFQLEGSDQTMSATIGLARLNEIDGNGSDSIKAANMALSRAKENARGGSCYFSPHMEIETRTRVHLLQELRTAFDRNRLTLVYQPQFTLADRQIVGVEALLRWRTDDGRFIQPEQFIKLAEDSGLIVGLGEWVLRAACNEMVRLKREGFGHLRMAVNVSLVQFHHPDFFEMIDTVLAETRIDTALLEFEINESVAMLDRDFLGDILDKIRQRGITVAIDDFGTGFSSLNYLEKLHINRLKIDVSFVNQMMQSTSSLRVVETIVQLGRSLNIDVMAEGVENEAEFASLSKMGCPQAQGFLLARPLESGELMRRLRPSN